MLNSLNIEQITEDYLQRRKHRRVTIELDGRFMLADGSEHRCRTVNISPGGFELAATARPRPEEKIIAYIEVLGRIEGRAVRTTPRGFALKCAASDLKRDKLAAQLTWLLNKDTLELEDERQSDRKVAGSTDSACLEMDGMDFPAKILDFSLKGVAFSCDLDLKLGQRLKINGKACVVVRLFDAGYGAAFVNGSAF